jgi:hypothetical protein
MKLRKEDNQFNFDTRRFKLGGIKMEVTERGDELWSEEERRKKASGQGHKQEN